MTDEITKISVRVDRNGVVKSGTRAIPAVESLHPSVVALEFETLSRDVAKAAGLPVPDRKPKGLEDFSLDLVASMEGVAGILARLYETGTIKGIQAAVAYREVLADLGRLVVHAQSLNKSLMALETALKIEEFLGEDGK